MCGIAGIVRLDGTPLPDKALNCVKAMARSMSYRGPDGEGFWLDGPVCLGHRRLSIIDVVGGAQPMADAGNNFQIVFNGEIYNFKELKSDLEKKGYVFRTKSDTEVILNSYAEYGEDCLEHLEGMFAFALWDKKRKVLFCARDHFGKKPFYYTVQNGFFAFASEAGSLALLGTSTNYFHFGFSLDAQALTRYLAYEYVPAPQTMYAEMKTLEPSEKLVVENGSLSKSRYWDLPFPQTRFALSENEAMEELRELMLRATRLRMISDVPLGVFLSGGIDSSIITGLMAELSPTPIQSFSIGFHEGSYDESRYAKIAAKTFGTIHHERILSAEDCADALPGIVRRMDMPMADASCAPTWLLSGLARENVTVCLGGDGADEFWAGYEHYIGFRIARLYNRFPHWFRRFLEKIAEFLPASAGYINPRLAVKTFFTGATAPDWLRVQTMLTAFGPGLQKDILSRSWLDDHAKDMLDQETLFASTKRHYENWLPESGATPLDRAFNVYIRQFMLDDILMKVDRCSMLHSLEVRAPFLDKKVAEFVARLPVSCKLRGFKRKYLLKKSFSNLLPPEILRRNKRGFQIPVAEWLRGKLKPLLLDMLSAERLGKQGIFNSSAVENLISRHLSKEEELRKQLWTLLVLQLWLEANKKILAA